MPQALQVFPRSIFDLEYFLKIDFFLKIKTGAKSRLFLFPVCARFCPNAIKILI